MSSQNKNGSAELDRPICYNREVVTMAKQQTVREYVEIKVPVVLNTRIKEEEKRAKVLDFLASDVFKNITIHAYAFRADVFTDVKDPKGSVAVGDIIGYDADTNELTVKCYGAFKDALEALRNKIAYIITSYDGVTNKISRIFIEERRESRRA